MLDTRPILLAALLTAAATAAAAQTCRDLVDRLAEQHALHAAPPAAPDTAGLPGSITPEELAQSGGAIQPPPTGDDEAVIAPPPTGDPMPTAPPLEGSTSAGELAAGEPAHQVQVAALLAAARTAAEQGDEPLCRERLEEAQNLIAGVRGG